MKTKYPNLFGILAGILLVTCFILLPQTLARADNAIDVGKTTVIMPAMLSSPSSVNFALSSTNNGETLEPAAFSFTDTLGAIAAIVLARLTALLVLAIILLPFVPFFRHVINKFREIFGDTDSKEVNTLHRVHRVSQPLSHFEAKPAS